MAKTNGTIKVVRIGGFLLGVAVILTSVVLAYASVDERTKHNKEDIVELKEQAKVINKIYTRQEIMARELDIELPD